jgi:hypothetical protein
MLNERHNMDPKTLEFVRNNLSFRVSLLVQQSERALKEGEALQSERLWEQMRGMRSALEMVEAMIQDCEVV